MTQVTSNEASEADRRLHKSWEGFGLTWKPSIGETLSAAFRLNSMFGAAQENSLMPSYPEVIGYDPIQDPIVPTNSIVDVANSRSPSETRTLLRRAKRQQNDRETLSQAGVSTLLFSEALVGLTDPINVVFGGSAILGKGALKSFIAGAKSGLKAGVGASVISESYLQNLQPGRPLAESAMNIFASGALGAGFTGAISIGRFTSQISKFNKVSKALHKDLSTKPTFYNGSAKDYRHSGFTRGAGSKFDLSWNQTGPSGRRAAPGIGGGLDKPGSGQMGKRVDSRDVPTWGVLDSAQQMMFPGARTRNSPFKSVSDISEKLVESNTLKVKNLESDQPSAQAVETLAKQHEGAMVQVLGGMSGSYRDYRLKVKGDSENISISAVKDKFSDILGGTRQHLSPGEFRVEITKTLRSGEATGKMDVHPISQVNDAAKVVREMFDYYAEESVKVGLLSADQVLKGYTPRAWNQPQVMSRRAEFVKRITQNQLDNGITPDKVKINAQVDRIIENGSPIEGSSTSGPRGIFQERELVIDERLFEDFLINDIDDLLRSYIRVMSVDLELARKFGRVDMEDQIKAIRKEGEALVLAVYKSPVGNPGENQIKSRELRARMQADIEAIEALRDIIRGIYGLPENPYGISSRAARLAMDFNNVLMLGGATFASLTDSARIVMRVGLTDAFKGLDLAVNNFDALKGAAKEIELAGTSLDMATQSTAMRLTGMQDLPPRFTKAESMMGYLTNGFFIANLLSPWNAFIKKAAGISIQHNMLGDSLKWVNGTLNKMGQARMLSAGLTKDDATKFVALFKEHGDTVNDVRIPNTQLWGEKNVNITRKWRAALARDVDATIVTPGAGDQPLWTRNSTWGRLIGQYKSFSFAAANKVLVPGLQYKDAAQLHGAMMMVFFGGLIASTRDRMNGNTQEKSMAEFVTDGIDQSGLLGWYFHANNMVEAITDGRVGVRPLTGQQMTNYSARFKAGSVSPTLSTAGNLFDFVTTGEGGGKLVPGRTLFYLRFGEQARQRKNLETVINSESGTER